MKTTLVLIAAAFVLIGYGLRQPFFPSEQFQYVLAVVSGLVTFLFCYFFLCVFRQRDPKWRWGGKYISYLWRSGQRKEVVKYVASLPLMLPLFAFVLYVGGIAIVGLVSMEVEAKPFTMRAECLSANRGRQLGIVNNLRVEGGREVRLRGFDQVCSRWYPSDSQSVPELVIVVGRESWFGRVVERLERAANNSLDTDAYRRESALR